MNALERILMYALVVILVLTGIGCNEFQSPDHLRNATHADPSAYFENNDLRANTLSACHSGTAAQQTVWEKLDACKMAESAQQAKKVGWKP